MALDRFELAFILSNPAGTILSSLHTASNNPESYYNCYAQKIKPYSITFAGQFEETLHVTLRERPYATEESLQASNRCFVATYAPQQDINMAFYWN
jgi:hypothetical protein